MRNVGSGSLAALAILLPIGAAWAGGAKDGHYGFGEPGTATEVTRTVEVIVEDRDGMKFVMDVPSIRLGEVIRFVITNTGSMDHEFSVGDRATQLAHAKLMANNPDIKHMDDPTSAHVAPGETKSVIWKFNQPIQGDVVFACPMAGHLEAGMTYQAKLETHSKPKTS